MPDPPEAAGARRRFFGALCGSAIGDALALPLKPGTGRLSEEWVAEMEAGSYRPAGTCTDVTEMTLCVAASLLDRQVFDPDDVARRLADWAAGARDIPGEHTRSVLAAIASGTHWETASRAAAEAATGASPDGCVSRCTPLSMFLYRHPQYVAQLAPMLCSITHADPESEWSCAFFSLALCRLLAGADRQAAFSYAWDNLADAPEPARSRLAAAAGGDWPAEEESSASSTVRVAVHALLNTTTFEEAVTEVVNRAGEPNGAGAATGALAGAHYGDDALPARWMSALTCRREVEAAAAALLDLASADA